MPYKDPEARKAAKRRYYERHPEKLREKWEKWRQNWRQKDPDAYREARRLAKTRLRRRKGVPARSLTGRRAKNHRELRLEVIQYLGGCCSACGFDDQRALELDHVNGSAALGRRNAHGKRLPLNHTDFLRILAGEYEPLQVLCANCHRIKTWESGDHRSPSRGKPQFHHETPSEVQRGLFDGWDSTRFH